MTSHNQGKGGTLFCVTSVELKVKHQFLVVEGLGEWMAIFFSQSKSKTQQQYRVKLLPLELVGLDCGSGDGLFMGWYMGGAWHGAWVHG